MADVVGINPRSIPEFPAALAVYVNGEPLLLKSVYQRWRYLTGAYVDYLGLEVIPFNPGRQQGLVSIRDLDLSRLPTPGKPPYREGVIFEGDIYLRDGDGWTARGAPIGPTKVSDHYIMKSVFKDHIEGALRDTAVAMNRQLFGAGPPIVEPLPRRRRIRRWFSHYIGSWSRPLRRTIAKKIYNFEQHEDWDY